MNHIRLAGVIIGSSIALIPALAFASFFDRDLHYGDRGSAVVELQEFLIERGYLSADAATGNFFSLTLSALKAFQSEQGISPASGFFGSLTRARANTLAENQTSTAVALDTTGIKAQIAMLLQQVQALQLQIASMQKPTTPAQQPIITPTPIPTPTSTLLTPSQIQALLNKGIPAEKTPPTITFSLGSAFSLLEYQDAVSSTKSVTSTKYTELHIRFVNADSQSKLVVVEQDQCDYDACQSTNFTVQLAVNQSTVLSLHTTVTLTSLTATSATFIVTQS